MKIKVYLTKILFFLKMRRKTKTSLRAQNYANRAIKSSRKALLVDVCEGMHELALSNENRWTYGHVTNLVVELKPKEKWLSRNIMNKAFIKYRCGKKKELEQQKSKNVVPDSILSGIDTSISTMSELSNVSSTQGTIIRKAGRPVGSVW